MSQEEKKDQIIATTTTIIVLVLLFIFMAFCGLTYSYPPPAPRLELLIEMTMEGGGGGGGNMHSSTNRPSAGSAENIVTSHDVNIPVIPRSTLKQANATSNAPVEDVTPKANPNAAYRPGMGGGNGGGSGTGHGSGVGSGFGSGEGSGSGGGTGSGIGYGKGNRANTYLPSVTISEQGRVYVRVHVTAEGTVIDAQIMANSEYPTSITNSKIREECIQKAKTARYVKGKDEFRIIVFSS